jgi:hypothetical protein
MQLYLNTIMFFSSIVIRMACVNYSFHYHVHIQWNLTSIPLVNQAACCSNLTWLMTRISSSALLVVSMSSPTYLVIDDLDYLPIISYNNKLFRYSRTTITLITSTSIATQSIAISYYNKQYFVGMLTISISSDTHINY